MGFVCKRCGNKDERYIGYKFGVPYCRKCISFRDNNYISHSFLPIRDIKPYLKYPLSKEQEEISTSLLEEFKLSHNSLVHAVCGAGKTEIVLSVVSYALSLGLRVGFAIPRKDVVIEIYDRFKDIFPGLNVVSIYGGHTDVLQGDLLILTTHQLYRYKNYFDLLIVDEIDAFPFNGSSLLLYQLKESLRGNFIYMSATPSKEVLEEFNNSKNKKFELFIRFHRNPLPVPIKKRIIYPFSLVYLIIKIKKIIKDDKSVFIFCPTIEIANRIYPICKLFISSINVVHSKKEDRNNIIKDFKLGKYKALITTSILERGVTVKDLQVIVLFADHPLFNKSTLIQISGRVGRKIDAPGGEVIFVYEELNNSIEECIKEIVSANRNLQEVLSKYGDK